MTRAGFSRRHTSRPQMNKGSYQGTTSVVPTVALFLVGGGLQPAEVHVRVKRLRSMPKPYDPEPTPAALSEFCARARITDPTRRSAPVANPYSHTWIRISSMVSVTYEQFPAKPLKTLSRSKEFSRDLRVIGHPFSVYLPRESRVSDAAATGGRRRRRSTSGRRGIRSCTNCHCCGLRRCLARCGRAR